METLYYLLDEDRIEILISSLEDRKFGPNSENLEMARRIIIDKLHLPIEDEEINNLVVNEYFIELFLLFFYGQDVRVLEHVKDIYAKERLNVAIRKFDSIGKYYCGFPLVSDSAIYDIYKGEPLMITLVDENRCNEFLSTEMGWLHKQEIRLLSSLIFSVPAPHGPINALIPLHENILVPMDFIFGTYPITDPLALNRSHYAIMLIERLHHFNNREERKLVVKQQYEFDVESQSVTRVHKILDNFNTQDDLLLRTAFLLLKSVFLLKSDFNFIEDSAANLYYGIEGCLRLIHREKIGGEFKVKEIIDFLKKNFIEDYAVTELLDEIYKKRLQIVHPENVSKTNWIPEIEVDEYFEHMGFAFSLFFYAVTEEFLPPHYTYH